MCVQWRWYFTLCLLLFGSNVFAQAQSDTDQLRTMVQAAEKLNYEGVFTFQSGTRLQSIRIIHYADSDSEMEHLLSLDGVPREMIRHDDRVTCVYPEGKSVQDNHRPLGRGFPIELLHRLWAASTYYSIQSGAQKRIANRQAREVVMKPVDVYRYGYRLWADMETDLLLQADLVAPSDDVLQRFVFSTVNINTPIAAHLFELHLQGNKVTWNRAEQRHTLKPIAVEVSPWQVTWLPEGFTLRSQQTKVRARNGALIEQRVYSDGLSALSVFFEKIRAHHQHLRGGMRRGIVNVYGTIQNGHFVTVVGEVPALTVARVARSIQYQENSHD